MSETIRTLIALDADVDRDAVQTALPAEADLQIVGFVEGLEESWNALQATSTDLLVVVCPGYSDRALFFIEGAVKQHPERPIVVICESSPNGFVRRVFGPVPTTSSRCPSRRNEFSSRSRRQWPESRARPPRRGSRSRR